MLTINTKKMLLDKAREALNRSYVPYSGNRVGAAILTANNNIYVGANIGNSCSTLNCCAEQVAVNSAVMSSDHELVAIAICKAVQEPCFPCGRCLQILAEFADDMVILTESKDGMIENSLKFLLPVPFRRTKEIIDVK